MKLKVFQYNYDKCACTVKSPDIIKREIEHVWACLVKTIAMPEVYCKIYACFYSKLQIVK